MTEQEQYDSIRSRIDAIIEYAKAMANQAFKARDMEAHWEAMAFINQLERDKADMRPPWPNRERTGPKCTKPEKDLALPIS